MVKVTSKADRILDQQCGLRFFDQSGVDEIEGSAAGQAGTNSHHPQQPPVSSSVRRTSP